MRSGHHNSRTLSHEAICQARRKCLPSNGPESLSNPLIITSSVFLRSARVQNGGKLSPRILRPVRTRQDRTKSGSKSSPPTRLAELRSVLCLASGA